MCSLWEVSSNLALSCILLILVRYWWILMSRALHLCRTNSLQWRRFSEICEHRDYHTLLESTVPDLEPSPCFVRVSPSPRDASDSDFAPQLSCRDNTLLISRTFTRYFLTHENFMWAFSNVCGNTTNIEKFDILPCSSRIVAYWLLASGHEARLQIPVRLYSFLQKLWPVVLKTFRRRTEMVPVTHLTL